jgi:hypothetical protein
LASGSQKLLIQKNEWKPSRNDTDKMDRLKHIG